MSDTRRVARDTKRAVENMSNVAVEKAHGWLEALMRAHHRGPSDTWTAARDRAARSAGIDPTYAKRLWQRWQSMKDVSGGVLLALQEAYEAQCERNDRMADHHRAVREAINHGATDEECRAADAAMAAAAARPEMARAETQARGSRNN